MIPPCVLIVGATSAIANAVARRYAARGAALFGVARRMEALEANAQDLRVRGAASVHAQAMDANDIDAHAAVLEAAWAALGGMDVALVAHGVLPDQARCEATVAEMLATFDTNARSTLALLTLLGNRFAAQGAGAIGVISSPAADRGRASNYAYGAAKAAVSTFASGLRNRLHSVGVRVVTIEPGFVDTPMTAGFAKGPLWADPARVASDIEAALDHGFGVVYTPWFWRWIMVVIRHLPERLFVRMKL
jgi:short-subunit dehydrogenase